MLTTEDHESSLDPNSRRPSLVPGVTAAGEVPYSLERHVDLISDGKWLKLHYDLLRVLAAHLERTYDPECPGNFTPPHTDAIVNEPLAYEGGLSDGPEAHPGLRYIQRNPESLVFFRISPQESLTELRSLLGGPEHWLNGEICRYRYCQILSVIPSEDSTRYHLQFHQGYDWGEQGIDNGAFPDGSIDLQDRCASIDSQRMNDR